MYAFLIFDLLIFFFSAAIMFSEAKDMFKFYSFVIICGGVMSSRLTKCYQNLRKTDTFDLNLDSCTILKACLLKEWNSFICLTCINFCFNSRNRLATNCR